MKTLNSAFAKFIDASATSEVRKIRVLSNLSAVLLAVLAFLTFVADANAGGFLVTNTNDSGAGSLRQAIIGANSNAGADIIEFDQSFFNEPRTIVLTSGELDVTSDITIEGGMTKGLTISGNNASRIFTFTTNTSTINNVTLVDGKPGGLNAGGAIRQLLGTLTINNSTISGNNAFDGGGIYSSGGTMTINNSTISGNSGQSGSGLENNGSSSSITLNHTAVAFNSASGSGGGIRRVLGTIRLYNSIVSNNTAPVNPDYSGSMLSMGYNIIGNSTGINVTGNTTGNQLNTDPLLVPLADNKGGTATHALQHGSPAIDSADPNSALTEDQRFSRRAVDGDRNGVGRADVGAYEKQFTKFDFDGDGKSNLAVYRIENNNGLSSLIPNSFISWYIQTNDTGYDRIPFGQSTDRAVPADYDGDSKTDTAVFRGSTGIWHIPGSYDGLFGFNWGLATDVLIPEDYDGDAKYDVAVYRNGVWYILGSQAGYAGASVLGTASDTPVPADYDGDGRADIAIFNAGVWTIQNSGNTLLTESFGQAGDIPVPADYDGDGKANLAVFRPSDRKWYVARPVGIPAQNFDATEFGLATDTLVPGDYDGDGKSDIAVERDGTWWILGTESGLMTKQFGISSDDPIPNTYLQ
ncbi:MAG: VCBS repeat-containing protein [Pyrinomonadaceae bacterium]|nr:VCBS repeat-containing protein [Pyrinomonadaceae bacterium]